MNLSRAILATAIAGIVVTACGGDEWQAVVHTSKGGAGQVIGVYESREACQEAGVMHVNEDKAKAHSMMASKNMSVGCALLTDK